MRVLTTEEAARRVGVEPGVIRLWATRYGLEPVNPGRKPVRYREADVIECAAARTSKKRHAELDALAAKLDNS